MEIKFQNSKAISIDFPNRKLRNKEEKNWNISKEQRMFLEKETAQLDGSSSDVIIKYKIPPYLKEKVVRNELNINGFYIPEQKDPEIESLLETQERILLNGKTINEANFIELLQAGILKL